MTIILRHLMTVTLSVATPAVLAADSHAGPRVLRIMHTGTGIDAAYTLSAPQSIAAQMHRQPTVCSVAAAEQALAGIARDVRRAHARCRR